MATIFLKSTVLGSKFVENLDFVMSQKLTILPTVHQLVNKQPNTPIYSGTDRPFLSGFSIVCVSLLPCIILPSASISNFEN